MERIGSDAGIFVIGQWDIFFEKNNRFFVIGW